MSNTGQQKIHQHSGWLIPLAFALAVLLLSGLFLGWYLRPGPPPPAAPTGQSGIVELTIQGTDFAVPANYIQNPAARAGGNQNSLALAALFPSLRGYSDSEANLFQGNAADSPVIHINLRADTDTLDAKTRLRRVYKPYAVNPTGTAGPFGLTQYEFRPNSGYERNDLLVGQGASGLVLLLCERAAGDLSSPNCRSTDQPLERDLSITYRFKRAYLARWREIDSGIHGLVRKFERR
jgi:hypothetical protein